MRIRTFSEQFNRSLMALASTTLKLHTAAIRGTAMVAAAQRQVAAEMIAAALERLKSQAEGNDLPYLATLLARALEEAREQQKE
jgi:hypothetical protein